MKKDLSLRLKQLRSDETQADFASKLGLSQVVYGRYENGSREPNIDTLCNIALTLRVSIDWLLGLDDGCDGNDESWQHRARAAERKLSKVNTALGHVLKGAKELQSILEDEE